MNTPSLYQKAIKFAALKHQEQNQKVPGTELPYVVHLSNVAMEILIAAPHTAGFDTDFAVQLALLHDTIEDTETTGEELAAEFGAEIAEGVRALTKNPEIPKTEAMTDSLRRIKTLRKEVWAVKLADRITNLQTPPPFWSLTKKSNYQKEAIIILNELQGGNAYLEHRLRDKIQEYNQYLSE
ncbi:MAG: HD domain-containing protein [Spirosomataceae bacterium]